MSEFANKLLPKVKMTLREASSNFDDEIVSYIDTVAADLQNSGILSYYFDASRVDWEVDPQIIQAVRWYCLSVYGLYNADMEKYAKAYASLKATLATQKKYTRDYTQSSTPEENAQLNKILKDLQLLTERVEKLEKGGGTGGSGEGTKVTVNDKYVETFDADTKLDKGSLAWEGNSLKNSSMETDDWGNPIIHKSSISSKKVSVSRNDSWGTNEIAITSEGIEMSAPSGEVTKIKFPPHNSGEQYGEVELARNQLAGTGSVDKAGLVYTPSGSWNGINSNNGVLTIMPASNSQIDGKTNQYNAIVPKNLDYAVRSVVGENIDDHERRLEDLESVLLTYQEDKTQAYEKVVPSAVAPNAILDSIGGESIASKNLYNPKGDFSVNADGSIRISEEANMSGTTTVILPSITLNAGTYYIKYNAIGNASLEVFYMGDDSGDEINPSTLTIDKTTTFSVRVDFDATSSETGGCEVDLYVMVSKTDIPFEPYFEGLRHAPVTEVKSQNTQLLDPSILEEGYFDINTGGYVSSTLWRSFKLFLKAGKYTISSDIQLKTGKKIEDGVVSNYSITTPHTFAVNKDCVFGLSYYGANSTEAEVINAKIMLNRGEKALPYQEFGNLVDSYTIPDGIKSLTDYGKKYTYVDFDNKQFVNNSHTIVLTGDEPMDAYKYGNSVGVSIGNADTYPYGANGRNATNTPYVSNAVSNAWVARYGGAATWLDAFTAYGYNANWADKTNPTSEESKAAVAQFKADLAKRYAEGNPVVIVYQVETGTTTDISQHLTDYDEYKLIKAQTGGTIVFENEHKVAPLSTITYVKAKG